MAEKFSVTFVMIFFLLVVSACGTTEKGEPQTPVSKNHDSGSYPVTVTDGVGRQVLIPARPKRIVSLAPSVTEILFAAGLGEKVAGVTTYCNYPPQAEGIEKIGTYREPSLEKIVALQPDLVVGDDSKQDLSRQLEELEVPFLVLAPKTVAGVLDSLSLVGKATGAEARAAEVRRELQARLDQVQEKLAAVPETARPLVYYEVYSDPLMTAGPGTFIHQIITLAGGTNIAADAATAYPEFSLETLVQRNPQVIVFPEVHGSEMTTVEKIKLRPGWGEIRAVREGEIYGVGPDLFSRPGPRVVDAVEQMAAILHPEIFTAGPKEISSN